MEKPAARLHRGRETLDTVLLTHLKSPPHSGICEDLGTSFGHTNSQTSERKPTQTRNGTYDLGFDSISDDEMDCLSQTSHADKKLAVKKQTDKNRSDYSLRIIEDKSRALKKLKFRKTKAEVEEEKPRKPSFSPLSPSKVKTSPREPHPRYDTENYPNEHEDRENDAKPKIVSPNSKTTRPQPRPRPRPRPATLPTSIKVDDISVPFRPIPATNKLTQELPLPSPISKATAGSSRRTLSTSSTISSSSSSSNASNASSSSHIPPLSSSYTSAIASSKSASRIQQSFPTLSPLNSPKKKRSKVVATKGILVISSRSRKDRDVKEFPGLSPLSSHKSKAISRLGKKSKGRRKADPLTPFPMSTQDFNGISPSEDESTVGTHYTRKRRLQIVDEASAMVNHMDMYEEEDSLFMSPSIDPNTLCPYCDTSLPPSPSPFFLNLLKSTLSRSYADPRSTNPLGRKAPLSTFVAVCQRHDFETKVLPEAEVKGWPKSINWEKLGDRVSRMKPDLEEIIRDSGEADLRVWTELQKCEGGDLMTALASKGPRIQCVFWREAMKSFLKSGARAMADVRGQFQNFERSQPGYYGELGQIIIQQTLFDMFPPDSFDLKLIKPFTANDFIQRILVPEVALRLIIEDRRLKGLVGAEAALSILRESTTYGVTMFPEDSGEGIGASGVGREGGKARTIGVGDRIVMERAVKRRKEIESGEVEALFEDTKESGVTGEGKKGKGRRMKATTGQGDDTFWSQDSEPVEHERNPLRRQSKKVCGIDDDDVISINSKTNGDDSENSERTDGSEARSRPRRNTKRINYNEHSDTKSSRAQCSGHSLSKLESGSSSRIRSQPLTVSESWRVRSPSSSEQIPQRSRGEVIGSKAQHLEVSDMDLCSTDNDSGLNQEPYKLKSTKTSVRKSGRSLGKPRTHGSSVIDLDVNTPLPKRHGIVVCRDSEEDEEPTPRPMAKKSSLKSASQPKQPTVLALARVRASKAGDTDRELGKSKMPELKKLIQDEWYPNIRASMSHMSGGSNESESSVDVVEVKSDHECRRAARKGKGEGTSEFERQESFSWLLDDPLS